MFDNNDIRILHQARTIVQATDKSGCWWNTSDIFSVENSSRLGMNGMILKFLLGIHQEIKNKVDSTYLYIRKTCSEQYMLLWMNPPVSAWHGKDDPLLLLGQVPVDDEWQPVLCRVSLVCKQNTLLLLIQMQLNFGLIKFSNNTSTHPTEHPTAKEVKWITQLELRK